MSEGEYKVRVFAVMRNTHEGVRGWLNTMKEDAVALAEGDSSPEKIENAQKSLSSTMKLIDLHMEHEEKVPPSPSPSPPPPPSLKALGMSTHCFHHHHDCVVDVLSSIERRIL